MPTYIPPQSSIAVFQARTNTTQTLTAANTTYPLNLQVEDFDDLNGHSTTTNISRYVIQRAGLYNATGTVLFGTTATMTAGTLGRVPSILKNGSIVGGSTTWGIYSGANQLLHVIVAPILINCAVNDYIELGAFSQLAGIQTAGDASNGSVLRVDFIR